MSSCEDAPCVNCGSKHKNISRNVFSDLLEKWPATIALFTEWLSPYIIKESDVVCKFCVEYAQNQIRRLIKTGQITDETQPLPSSIISQIENRKICVLCAKSLNQRRSKPVLWPNGPEKNQLVSNYICQTKLLPHKKIDANSHVCYNCWSKTILHLNRMQLKSAVNKDTQNHYPQDRESQYNKLEEECYTHNGPIQGPSTCNLEEECIELPSYRRSPDNSSNCIFENCTNEDLHSITEELRATIIKNHHYLVTAQARVCQQHLLKNYWAKLFEANNSISTFKPDHIEHVLSFVATSKCTNVDFNNILNFDNSVVEYFLGVSKESFSVILKTLPELQGVENGVFGLMGLLMKHWNGGSITKVAGLLKICPRTLETAMMQVLEVLKYSPVTVNMGIEYLLKANK